MPSKSLLAGWKLDSFCALTLSVKALTTNPSPAARVRRLPKIMLKYLN